MVELFSQAWLDLQGSLAAGLPERPGASARLQIVVTGAPSGEVTYGQRIEDGRLARCSLGVDTDADVTLTETWDDAVAIARGALDANVAFMQGRVKVVGSMGALMAVMPLTQSPPYRALVAELATQTEV